MLTLEELSSKIASYRNGGLLFHDLENWFEDHSAQAYARPELREAFAAVEGAFAQYHFDHIGESAFREELAAAVRPFADSVAPDVVEPTSRSTAPARKILVPLRSHEMVPILALATAVAVMVVVQPDTVRKCASSSASPLTALVPVGSPSV